MLTREEAAKKFREKAADPYYVPRQRELYQMAADALSEPEIIRCKECEHGEAFVEGYMCRCSEDWHRGDHFCAYGKRKE